MPLLLDDVRESLAQDFELSAGQEREWGGEARARKDYGIAAMHESRAALLVQLASEVRHRRRERLASDIAKDVIDAVLLFHSARWTGTKTERWQALTGRTAATAKALCGWLLEVRVSLGDEPQDEKNPEGAGGTARGQFGEESDTTPELVAGSSGNRFWRRILGPGSYDSR